MVDLCTHLGARFGGAEEMYVLLGLSTTALL